MQFGYEEKRRCSRLNLSLPLHYQIRGSQEFGNTVTKNISTGGVSFIIDRFIKPQTRIILDINILSKNINSIGIVRWAGNLPHSDKYQVGLEFVGITPTNKNYISDYIDMHFLKEGSF